MSGAREAIPQPAGFAELVLGDQSKPLVAQWIALSTNLFSQNIQKIDPHLFMVTNGARLSSFFFLRKHSALSPYLEFQARTATAMVNFKLLGYPYLLVLLPTDPYHLTPRLSLDAIHPTRLPEAQIIKNKFDVTNNRTGNATEDRAAAEDRAATEDRATQWKVGQLEGNRRQLER